MEMIDLSHPIRSGMREHITVTVAPLLRHGDAAGRFDPPCEGFAANVVLMSDHCGTHLDSPFHFFPGRTTIDELPLGRVIGPAVVCDLSAAPGPQIEEADMAAALDAMQPKTRKGGFILLRTQGADGRGRGLSKGAAQRLVDLGVTLVGTDHGTVDNAANRDRPGHMTLLGNDVLIIESMANLDKLLGREALLIATPLRFEKGTGSPIRPVAILPFIEADWPALG